MIEHALGKVMADAGVTDSELIELGFDMSLTLKDRLLSFVGVQDSLEKVRDSVAKFTDLEH